MEKVDVSVIEKVKIMTFDRVLAYTARLRSTDLLISPK